MTRRTEFGQTLDQLRPRLVLLYTLSNMRTAASAPQQVVSQIYYAGNASPSISMTLSISLTVVSRVSPL